jgi:hypothetical protein
MKRSLFRNSTATVSFALLLVAAAHAAEVNNPPADGELALGIADLKLVIPAEDWEIGQSRHGTGDAGAYYLLTSAKRDLVFSFFMEKIIPCKTAAACRDLALTNPAYRTARNVLLTEYGRFSVAQFELEVSANPRIRQTHLLAEIFVNGVEVDIHLSRTGSAALDAGALFEFLNEITFK